MGQNVAVREFREDDDFDWFDKLVWDEHNRRGERIGIKMNGPFSVDTGRLSEERIRSILYAG